MKTGKELSNQETQRNLKAVIAMDRFIKKGRKPKFSHDICDQLSVGYGELDDSGFWEYQLCTGEENWKVLESSERE